MKKVVKAADLKGNDLQQYINNVRKEVERDLNPDVNSIDWDMNNNTVYLTVEFKNGVSEAFPFEAWRFTGEPAYFDYDVDIIVDAVRNYMKSEEMEGYESPRYKFIKSKRVLDSDGFYTDYTMYYDTESDQYIFIFGDNDLYDPATSDWDWTCEGERQANEWFDSYNGFDEDDYDWHDDIESCDDIMSSEEFVDMGTGLEYWYFTTHGVQPGSVPKSLNIIEVKDTPNGTYFKTDRVITTKALKYYDIKEKVPEDVKSSFDPIEDMDASDVIGKLNTGDKFKNRNGVVVEIVEPTKNGLIQFKIGDDVRMGSEKSIQKMLYRNNYMRKVETSDRKSVV